MSERGDTRRGQFDDIITISKRDYVNVSNLDSTILSDIHISDRACAVIFEKMITYPSTIYILHYLGN